MDGVDFQDLSGDELQSELVRIEALKRRLASYEVGLVAEADRRQMPLADGCRTLRDWVCQVLDVSRDNAAHLVRLAKTDLPELAGRLADGETSVERAALLARVATPNTESEWWDRTRGHDLGGVKRLVDRHRHITADQERRSHADSYVWFQPRLDQSWWNIRGGLTGPVGQVVSDALRAHADQYPKDSPLGHRQALALEELVTGGSGDEKVSVPDISVFVDLNVAHGTGGEAGADLAAGSRIGPDTLGELLCTGKVGLIGLKDGKPVWASPRVRTIPPALRDSVLFRDGGCRAKGCNSTHRLEVHHIVPWAHGGNHDPENLVCLCWYHHHVVVHRRGYRVETDQDGSIRFLSPADSRAPPN